VSFEQAATVFLDPLALTFPDPNHGGEDGREITVGHTADHLTVFVAHCLRGERVRIISARKATRGSDGNMKKASAKTSTDELRPEYDLSPLKGGIRGKYHAQAAAGTNLVLIEPELAEVFPDAESVNRALRLLAKTAAAVAPSAGRRQGAPKKPSSR